MWARAAGKAGGVDAMVELRAIAVDGTLLYLVQELRGRRGKNADGSGNVSYKLRRRRSYKRERNAVSRYNELCAGLETERGSGGA